MRNFPGGKNDSCAHTRSEGQGCRDHPAAPDLGRGRRTFDAQGILARLLLPIRIGRILGMISERDILHAVGERGAAALNDAVSKHMTATVVTTHEDESVDRAMEKMTLRRFRHLPVIADERLVGLVSIGDVVKYRLEQLEHEHQALREYIATA